MNQKTQRSVLVVLKGLSRPTAISAKPHRCCELGNRNDRAAPFFLTKAQGHQHPAKPQVVQFVAPPCKEKPSYPLGRIDEGVAFRGIAKPAKKGLFLLNRIGGETNMVEICPSPNGKRLADRLNQLRAGLLSRTVRGET